MPEGARGHRRRAIPRASRGDGRKYRAAGARRAPHRATERPANHVEHLLDVLVGLAPLRRRPDAALHVVLQDHDRDRVDRGPERGGLLEDVHAVLLALDHPSDPAHLALDPAEAADELGAVARVAVAKGRLVCAGAAAGVDGARSALVARRHGRRSPVGCVAAR